MGWKKWPYWLKGGIISVGIAILSTLVLIPFGTPESGWFSYYSIPMFIGAMPLVVLLALISGMNDYAISNAFPGAFLLYAAITYFLVGALVGLIYGKIKSKRPTK